MLNVDEAAPVKWGNYDLTGQAKFTKIETGL